MYTSLIWLFVFVVTGLMLFLGYLKIAKDRAIQKELDSLEYSHLVIEGMEIERRRIALELHDNVLPTLRGNAAASDTIRGICMELMPPDFSRIPLKNALVNICGQFMKRNAIECKYNIDKELDFSGFSARHQLHLYRIVQEVFTNIEKHSRAKKVSFLVRKDKRESPEKILFLISDDGIGLPENTETSGLGMKNMKYRAAVLGAQLDFLCESGNGLAVKLSIPPPPWSKFKYGVSDG